MARKQVKSWTSTVYQPVFHRNFVFGVRGVVMRK